MNRHAIERECFLHHTDATGVIYYSRYLEWLEEARLDFLTKKYKPLQELDFSFVPTEFDIKYKRPVKLGDKIKIVISVIDISLCSLSLSFIVLNNKDVNVEGKMKLACIKKGKVFKIPTDLKELLINCGENKC